MLAFEIEATCDEVLARLFETDTSSHLRFGWTGQSTATAQLTDVVAGPIRFRDYIMEGFLAYSVQLIDNSQRCTMQVLGEGSNRDWSIRPQVRHYIKAAGLNILGESVAEPSHAPEPAAEPESNSESPPPAR